MKISRKEWLQEKMWLAFFIVIFPFFLFFDFWDEPVIEVKEENGKETEE